MVLNFSKSVRLSKSSLGISADIVAQKPFLYASWMVQSSLKAQEAGKTGTQPKGISNES